MSKFLIIQHEDNCPVDRFGAWWTEAGVELDIRRGRVDEIPDELSGHHDALVVLGGGMNCRSDADNPWLPATRALIAETIRGGRPFLGICLGHQLAALALGGDVATKEQVSMGLVETLLTDAGRQDRLLGPIPVGTRAVQYNYDHVTALPMGSVVLARAESDGHVQAIRFADRAWGFQFHPECSTETFDEWTLGKSDEKRPVPPEGTTLEGLAADVRGASDELEGYWKPVALGFLAAATS